MVQLELYRHDGNLKYGKLKSASEKGLTAFCGAAVQVAPMRVLQGSSLKAAGYRKRRAVTTVLAAVAMALWGSYSQAESTQNRAAFATSGVAPHGSTTDLKKLSVEELLDIEVTSVSRRLERLFDASSAVQVIGSEEIRRSGATRLPEVLRLAPNLHVAQIDSTNFAITARGFNNGIGNKLLVMIDGRTVYTPMFAGVFWDVQDTLLEDIDRLEVISGPGGTVWGANAVNGVISVTTKSAADTQGLLVHAGAGEELENYGDFRYGGAVSPDLHYRVYGKYVDRDSTLLPNGAAWTDDARSRRAGFRMDWNASQRDLVTVQADVYDAESSRALDASHVLADGGNILSRWERELSADSNLKLQFYYDRAHRFIGGQYTDDVDTFDLDFQHQFELGARHGIIWGLGYRQIENTFTSTPFFAFLPSRLSHQLYSTFIQDEIALIPERLTLTAGTKLEHNDYTGLEVQPSVRLTSRLTDKQTAWSAISRAVRTPGRIDRDFYIPQSPPFLIEGGPDFVSEVLIAYEAGYRVQPVDRLSVNLATYYNDYTHLRSVEAMGPAPVFFPFQVRNGLAGRSYGAELTAEYRPTSRIRLVGSYQYLNVRLHPVAGSNDTTSVAAEAKDPDRQVMLRSAIDLTDKLQFDAALRYVSGIDNDTVPDYEELDLRMAWRPWSRLELALVGQNLLHKRHVEFSDLANRKEIERTIYGKLTWGF